MKKLLAILCFIFITTSFACAKNFTSGTLLTKDSVKIAYNNYKTGHDNVLIIAPGWFMCKDSWAFQQMSDDFSKYYDVITFDFRGHCKSSGEYTFGSKETQDLATVVKYTKQNYQKIYLMGFSLGALISIDYCYKNTDVDNLVLVSAPVSFNLIENNIFNPNAFIPTFKKFEWERWTSIKFKPEFLAKEKPVPIDLIGNIYPTPIFLIAGEDDPIIMPWHMQELYKRVKTKKKEMIFKNSKHAEDIYLENRIFFVQTVRQWLDEN